MSYNASGHEVSLPTRLRHAVDDMRQANRPWTPKITGINTSNSYGVSSVSDMPDVMQAPCCQWCNETFESFDKLYEHRDTMQRWEIQNGNLKTHQCRLSPITINGRQKRYGGDIKVHVAQKTLEEDDEGKSHALQKPRGTNEKLGFDDTDEELDRFSDLDHEEDGLDSLGMSRAHFSSHSRDLGFAHPQYSSGVPKSSFMSSFGSRQSPMMPSYSSVRKTAFGLGSPKSYNTAKSSVASYVTAAGSPVPVWSQEASQLESGKRNKFQYYATALTESTAALASYDALVDEVVLRVFTTVECTDEGHTVVEVLSIHDQAELRNAVFKWLLLLNIHRTGPSREITINMIIDKLLNHLQDYKAMGRKLFHDFEESRMGTKDLIETLIMQFVPGQTFVPQPAHGKVFSSEWLQHLQLRGIIVDPKDELDWSGRGQHVEYEPTDVRNIPLKSEGVLGYSASAIVDRVMCRRIRLARKKIKCHRRLTKEDAIKEVEHLQKLQHSHIVQVVGTYTVKKELAILLYPATPWNLEEFMDEVHDNRLNFTGLNPLQDNRREVRALISYFGCLSTALAYIHGQFVKHMDIKPKNLLVQRHDFKIYIADFGIARAYQSTADSETDTPVAYTRTYAAPEVVDQDTRGFSADVFSLGCVFLEMFAVLLNQRNGLLETRDRAPNDTSYSANLEALVTWAYCEMVPTFWRYHKHGHCEVDFRLDFVDLLPQMLNKSPNLRPTAQRLADVEGSLGCGACNSGPDKFAAAVPWE